ncbi:hypothetical protein GUJ93_ZPchr0009g2032 [Zizania palustris]|uniref:Leucine-rich repeat-containing N-terminal plant-type domain-containing protein n=1 Tax=Zizania palustris TaxID=103762 RepID=A0A8J5RGY3_ZIZPA|nr:hypothetical protein GUJ93_ZPchr0009g2032 [Zizania palustris]
MEAAGVRCRPCCLAVAALPQHHCRFSRGDRGHRALGCWGIARGGPGLPNNVILLAVVPFGRVTTSSPMTSSLTCTSTSPSPTNASTVPTSRSVFRHAIYSDPKNFTTGWVGADVCSYFCVACAPTLDDPNTTVIAAELGLVTDIALFHINSNRFCGIIPKSFSKPTLLHELHVSNNRFVVVFPEVVLQIPVLKYLDLYFNDFEGELATAAAVREELRCHLIRQQQPVRRPHPGELRQLDGNCDGAHEQPVHRLHPAQRQPHEGHARQARAAQQLSRRLHAAGGR